MRLVGISLLLFGIVAIGDASWPGDDIEAWIEKKLMEIIQAGKLGPQDKPITLYDNPNQSDKIAEGIVKLNGSEIIWGKCITKHKDFKNDFEALGGGGHFYIDLAVFINTFLMKMGYDMDVAVIQLLPLYGKGELDLAVKSINLNVSIDFVVSISQDGINPYLNRFDLYDLSFKPDVSQLIGFLNNPEADDIFSNIINVGEEAFSLFYAGEKPCILCILQESIIQIVNIILKHEKSSDFEIDCQCLKWKPKKISYDLKSNLEGLVTSFLKGSVDDQVRYIFSDKMIPMWKDIYQRTVRLLDRKGLLQQFL